jgi:hypothetical protein
MDTNQRGPRPQDLVQAQERFGQWRGQRTRGERIPRTLWEEAVRLANAHGVSRTATALGLDYYSLKRRVEKGTNSAQPNPPAFVEWSPPMALAKQCQLELNNGSGATMRVQLVGYDADELEAISRSFWNAL